MVITLVYIRFCYQGALLDPAQVGTEDLVIIHSTKVSSFRILWEIIIINCSVFYGVLKD